MPTVAGFYFAESNLAKTPRIPVLLIHGAGSDHLCWPPEIRRIAGERVLAFDLPGHGRSGGICEQSVGGYAAQTLRFLDALGIYRAVFVGHSLGGAIALWSALNSPDRTAAIGLIASGASFKIPDGLLNGLVSQTTLPEALALLRAHLFSRRAEKSLVEKVMQSFGKARLSQLQSDWKAAADFDLRWQISGVRAPVWAAVGLEDNLSPPALMRYLASQLPQIKVLQVDGAGHMVMLEQPGKVGQGLNQFLKSLPLNLPENWPVA
ncbi:MAG: alpha/beta fold hydrolase [Anaerolineae bacterium]|nr:alpha/beta fold hydrolase [Anaerolineae bacterium]